MWDMVGYEEGEGEAGKVMRGEGEGWVESSGLRSESCTS